MNIIAHRANLEGPNRETENQPLQIEKCIELGFDVEIDVWYVDNNFWLGHDEPQYKISVVELFNWQDFVWLHCKNLEAMEELAFYGDNFNYFWHENDACTLTNKGYIWTHHHSFENTNRVTDQVAATLFGIVTEAYNNDEYYVCCDAPKFFQQDYLKN